MTSNTRLKSLHLCVLNYGICICVYFTTMKLISKLPWGIMMVDGRRL